MLLSVSCAWILNHWIQRDDAIWKYLIMCACSLKGKKALTCHRTSNPVTELLWVPKGHAHAWGWGRVTLPSSGWATDFYPVAEGCWPRPGKEHSSPEDLLPGSLPIYIYFPSGWSSGLQFMFIPVRKLAAWSMISCALMIRGVPLEEIHLYFEGFNALWFLYNGISFRLAS